MLAGRWKADDLRPPPGVRIPGVAKPGVGVAKPGVAAPDGVANGFRCCDAAGDLDPAGKGNPSPRFIFSLMLTLQPLLVTDRRCSCGIVAGC